MAPPKAGDLASEFPTYPPEDVPAFTQNLAPRHWRNNACPSWGATAACGDSLEVFVDYVDPARREFEDTKRFTVFRTADGAAPECVLETDAEADVVAYLQSAMT